MRSLAELVTAPAVVLIAEDEVPIAEVVAAVVEEAGCTAVVAAHGRQALELMHRLRPALVITDLMMPYVDGAELIARLRANAAACGEAPAPVILMTAASLQHAKSAGADALLRKPFDLSDLDEILRRFLHVHAGHAP